MKALNLSGTGQISLWEFCAACLRRPQYLAEPLLYDAFGMLDAESTGYIYPRNLVEVVGLSESDAALTVLEADADEVRVWCSPCSPRVYPFVLTDAMRNNACVFQTGYISYADYLRAMFAGGATSS